MSVTAPLRTLSHGNGAMNAHDWIHQYNATKRDIVSKRQTGRPVGAGDQRNLTNAITGLEKELRIMAQSPLEYDL
jgi:hypothetical protein